MVFSITRSRKKVPGRPKVPKGPVIFHKVKVGGDLRPFRQVCLSGGPWNGKKISSRIQQGDYTAVMNISGWVGRYYFSKTVANWCEVKNVRVD